MTTEIKMDEWLAEIEEMRASHPKLKFTITPEIYEIISAARENESPLPWLTICKFLYAKGLTHTQRAECTVKNAYDDYKENGKKS